MRRSLFVFVAVWLLASLAGHVAFVQDGAGDFASFYYAATAVRRQLNPYDHDVLRSLAHGHVWPYLYSPLVAVLCGGLSRLPLLTAFRVWTYLSTAAFAASAAIATHRTRTPTMLAIVFAMVAGHALNLVNVLQLGQINTIVVAFITAAFALRERRPFVAGACLAAAAVLKSSPLYLLLVIAAERRARMLASAVPTMLALCIFTLPFTGVATWQAFFALGDRASRLEQIPGLFPFDVQWSFSLVAMFMRAHLDARLFAPIVTLVLSVPIAIAAWRGRRGVVLSALAVMIVSAPLAYTHHIIYVFPGVMLVLVDAHAHRRRVFTTLFATALLLVSYTAGVDFPVQDLAGRNLAALLGLYALGLLA